MYLLKSACIIKSHNDYGIICRCYYGESLGDFCQIDGLCEATTPNAECRTTCQCKEGIIKTVINKHKKILHECY